MFNNYIKNPLTEDFENTFKLHNMALGHVKGQIG
jgi:hypothetical protein